MSDIALSISILALVAVLGLWIGNWRLYGVSISVMPLILWSMSFKHKKTEL